MLLVLITILTVVFTAAPARPVQREARQFHPIAYATDLVLPVLDLGQEGAFVPQGVTQWIAWAGSLCGWLLATTVIAGITRRLTRS